MHEHDVLHFSSSTALHKTETDLYSYIQYIFEVVSNQSGKAVFEPALQLENDETLEFIRSATHACKSENVF